MMWVVIDSYKSPRPYSVLIHSNTCLILNCSKHMKVTIVCGICLHTVDPNPLYSPRHPSARIVLSAASTGPEYQAFCPPAVVWLYTRTRTTSIGCATKAACNEHLSHCRVVRLRYGTCE